MLVHYCLLSNAIAQVARQWHQITRPRIQCIRLLRRIQRGAELLSARRRTAASRIRALDLRQYPRGLHYRFCFVSILFTGKFVFYMEDLFVPVKV